MNDNFITFISNNIKGIQMSQRKMKLFEYLKELYSNKRVCFLSANTFDN